jgi:hypothetical protein
VPTLSIILIQKTYLASTLVLTMFKAVLPVSETAPLLYEVPHEADVHVEALLALIVGQMVALAGAYGRSKNDISCTVYVVGLMALWYC